MNIKYGHVTIYSVRCKLHTDIPCPDRDDHIIVNVTLVAGPSSEYMKLFVFFHHIGSFCRRFEASEIAAIGPNWLCLPSINLAFGVDCVDIDTYVSPGCNLFRVSSICLTVLPRKVRQHDVLLHRVADADYGFLRGENL